MSENIEEVSLTDSTGTVTVILKCVRKYFVLEIIDCDTKMWSEFLIQRGSDGKVKLKEMSK